MVEIEDSLERIRMLASSLPDAMGQDILSEMSVLEGEIEANELEWSDTLESVQADLSACGGCGEE